MLLSARSRELLIRMIDAPAPQRIKDFADEFAVSPRTIKYDLESIRHWLHRQNVKLLSQPNKGIWLEGDDNSRKRLRELLNSDGAKYVYFNQQERFHHITISYLLTDKSLSISQLAEKLGVSRNTIVSDLHQVRMFLHKRNLRLEKWRNGLLLTGTEVDRRLALEYLLQTMLHGHDLLDIAQSILRQRELSWRVREVLTSFILPEEKINLIRHTVHLIIKQAKEQYGVYFSDRAIIGMFLRLCIVVNRVGRQQFVTLDQRTIEKMQKQTLFPLFCTHIRALSTQIESAIPVAEIVFASLQSLKRRLLKQPPEGTDPSLDTDSSLDIDGITQEMIRLLGERLDIDLQDDIDLYEALHAHLGDKLTKHRYGVVEPNPLAEEIIRSYPAMFQHAKQVCTEILSPHQIQLADSDIAYIVLHFQAAYERKPDLFRFRTLVVCGTGRGTARLLKSILENEYKHLHVVAACSVMEADRVLSRLEADLVVSILPIEVDVPTVIVGVPPSKEDLHAIKSVMEQVRAQWIADGGKTAPQEKKLDDSLSYMRNQLLSQDLPLVHTMTQEVICKGFQLSHAIIRQFEPYLRKETAQGLTLHIMLMVNRLAFGTPYLLFDSTEPSGDDRYNLLREQLLACLQEHQITLPDSEINAILRYFEFAIEGSGPAHES